MKEWHILLLHPFKPSLTSIIASFGVTGGMLLGGTVLVENIFGYRRDHGSRSFKHYSEAVGRIKKKEPGKIRALWTLIRM